MYDNYAYRIKRVVQITFFLLAICVLGWAFTSVPKFFSGVVLGTTIALISTLFSAWKVHKVGELALRHSGKKKRAPVGMLTRFSMAILATVIALEYPNIFSVPGMVLGLTIPTIIAFGDAIYVNIKQQTEGERGE